MILDIRLNNSELSGLQVFEKLVEENNLTAKVIILSGEASRLEVAKAMQLGAHTFIEKSGDFSAEKFLIDIQQAINLKRQEEQVTPLGNDKEKLRRDLMIGAPLIGKSPAMMRVIELISKFATSKIDVLIEGETGTGKDVVAKQIFLQSDRIGKPYVIVNSGGIAETLIDSELFGHKKGSFTGAYSDKKGYFEQANGGILFLDEIANLNLSIQAKILRAIEQKEIRVVGGDTKFIDVRLIFASNKKMRDLVDQKIFRDDLYYRLEGNSITLPPLREREDDIIYLLEHFCQSFSDKHTCKLNVDLKQLLPVLKSYSWPGNVRELLKFTEFLLVMYDEINNDIIIKELQNKKMGKRPSENLLISQLLENNSLSDAVEIFEKYYIKYHLDSNGQKVSNVADILGIDRTTLYKKIKKWEI